MERTATTSTEKRTGEISRSFKMYDYFEWTIRDAADRLYEPGSQLESPGFLSDGAVWRMTVTTRCKADDILDSYLNLELCRMPLSHMAKYHARIGVKKADGTSRQKASSETDFDGSLKVRKLMLYPQYVRSTGICRFLKDGCLTIYCELITPAKKWGDEPSNLTNKPVDSDISLLIENLKDLHMSGVNNDLELKVGGKVFKAHKAIVCARCPVFSSMFQHDMLENSSGVVEIPDCSADAFAIFIRYLYTGEMGEVSGQKLICNLYYIADKYNVRELKVRCSGLLLAALSVANFCDVVSVALRHNDSTLLKSLYQFFSQNMKAIIKTARWQTFLAENPTYANGLFVKTMDTLPVK